MSALKPVSNFVCSSPLSLAGSSPGLAAGVRNCRLGKPGTVRGGVGRVQSRWGDVQLWRFVLQGAGGGRGKGVNELHCLRYYTHYVCSTFSLYSSRNSRE
jgi:hypothetical protein